MESFELINLEARRTKWNKGHKKINQGDSLLFPGKKYTNLFINKDVLEIGPGEGRQFEKVYPLVASYSIADISPKVLSREIYHQEKVKERHLLIRYFIEAKSKFDLIHFWYVLHHIRIEELPVFVKFLYDNLNINGQILFNTCVLDMDQSEYGNDGLLTTPIILEQVRTIFGVYFLIIEEQFINANSTGFVISAIRKV